jgi:hypothetical protein
MGCDIHLYAEIQNGDEWVSIDHWTADEDNAGRLRVDFEDALYRNRNYELFALLANVRNLPDRYHNSNKPNWVSCDGGERVEPLSAPRGLPDDMSNEVQAEAEFWGVNGHSHTWYALRELVTFDWRTRKFLLRGVVTGESAQEYLERVAYHKGDMETVRKYYRPNGYARAISGETATDSAIAEWEETAEEACQDFLCALVGHAVRAAANNAGRPS